MKEKKALLVISFGTSYEETMEKTIVACEKKLAETFPEYDLKRAFTSHMIIRKLEKTKGETIDTPAIAMEKLHLQQYSHVLVQPLHIIPGTEYNGKVLDSILPFKGKFESLRIGEPLLYRFGDYEKTLSALEDHAPRSKDGEAIVFMGHGSDHPANSVYSCLQSLIDDNALPYHMGCVEGYPYLDRVIRRLKEREIKKVHLMPFMLVAGDHAVNDMAGDDEDSWISALAREGYETEIHLKGLGEYPAIRDLFVAKAMEAKEY